MAEVITTIGLRAVENVTIDSVSGSDPYTVTLSSATSSTDNGDSLQDEHTTPRSYLITAGAGTDTLTVKDSTGAGSPDDSGTSQATTTRYYSIVSGWDTGMVVGDLYAGTGDAPTGHIMNDGAIVEDNLDIKSTVVGAITLTVPVGERHDGSPGTGGRIEANSSATYILRVDSHWSNNIAEVSWIELDANGELVNHGIDQKRNRATPPEFQHLLIYDGGTRWGGGGIYQTSGSGGSIRATRCMVWNWVNTYDSDPAGNDLFGISTSNANSSRPGEIHNCTVYLISHAHASRTGYGISTLDHANKSVKNSIAIGADVDFDLDSPGSADYDYNCSSDTTTSGTNSLASETAANNFISTSPPVDLHLKAGSNCIGEGYDLGTTPANIQYDIDNYDVSSDAAWDIGADQVVAAFKAAWARFNNYIIGANKAGD